MSLFDEFDRLTPEKESRLPPERRPQSAFRGDAMPPPIPPPIPPPMAPSMPISEQPLLRPKESIRFSLTRGAVAAITIGVVVAAALLYAGGFVTAFVVLQPADEKQMAQSREGLPPPPLVDADRPRSALASKTGESGPLKVVMSRETSGGKALVTPQGGGSIIRPPAAPSKPVSAFSPPPVDPVPETPGAIAPLPPAPGGLAPTAPPEPSSISEIQAVKPIPPRKPVADKPSAPPVVSGSVAYTVQLGAFGSEANANQLKQKLSTAIPGLRVERGNTPSGRTLYYLRAGLFSARKEAKAFAARLKSEQKIKSGYVMRVRAPSLSDSSDVSPPARSAG
jgi:cell division septation protein DedD